MALSFEAYLDREYRKASATTSFTFVYIPPTGGTKAQFTILNAGAADVKTQWAVSGDHLQELNVFDPSGASPTTTTTE